ncbi:beta-propeller repeat protein [Leptospira interrogans serovar Valbuzzi str. Duyster]|uniref:SBBP repeat beta-propeller lipoprotein, LipL53 family n=1 Tax=Leptospira interrogans TaxID=173 RepID=UPI0002BB5157|nr:SBBP repeat-containing protein [Leptospira interrogans]EMJ54657.1 beta-propeller repeat protein [Leptospira interrogans serovar Valbuzzi str. Duyster]ENO73814.1 beta-propeller repeat protein [Leptospira interrogans serovar Valbuzzi str. Valbuzzi]
MVRVFLFIFICIQACSPIGELLNLNESNSKSFDPLWIASLIQSNNPAPLDDSDTSKEDIVNKNVLNANVDIPEWTLLVGAPNANIRDSALTIDRDGFIYIAGSTNAGIYSENLIGTRDIILAKYNSRKQTIWTKQVGVRGVSLDVADVEVDQRGNVYVIGKTSGNFAGRLTGRQDLFVIKFNTNGNEIWRRQKGSRNQNLIPEKAFVDQSGISYIVGILYREQIIGEPVTGFLFKIDSQGNWRRDLSISIPEGSVYPQGVVVANNTGDIFVTGTTNANLQTNTVPSTGNSDLFILKYDRSGRRQLFAQLGQVLSRTESNSIALDSFGNVFVGGMSNANFEPEGEVGESNRGILVKYNSLGVRQWIQYLGPIDGNRTTAINALSIDSEGNIFTTGQSNHMVDGRQNGIGMDLFLTKHDSLGNEEWVRQIGINNAMIIGNEIGQDQQGNLYCTGWTEVSINGVATQGNSDLFLLKLR